MSGDAEILCSRCGTPFPKEKDKAAVTCVVCGQLRPDLDLTLDDEDDEDLGAALGAGAAHTTTDNSGRASEPAVQEAVPPSHVLRVAAPASSTIDSPPSSRGTPPLRADQPYLAMSEARMPTMYGGGEAAPAPDERLMERIGSVLLIVCPLAAGMAGGLSMLARTDDFSAGVWYAVGAVFVIVLAAALVLGLVVTGLLFLLRVRWTIVIRVAFVAATMVAGSYGLRLLPGHIRVNANDLPGLVLRP